MLVNSILFGKSAKQIDFNFVCRYNQIVWGRWCWEYNHAEGYHAGDNASLTKFSRHTDASVV